MDRFDLMQAFVAVAEHGGFSAGGRALGVPVATVSRKIAQLEASLGAQLFTRSTRHVTLTEAGQGYAHACRRILEALRDADDQVGSTHGGPRGLLTLTAPLGFGRLHLQPVLHDFLKAHPDIQVDLHLGDDIVPLIEDGIDCAVRISPLHDSRLVARTLGHIRMMICAAPAYLRERGTPGCLADLSAHQAVGWTAAGLGRSFECLQVPGVPASLIKIPMHTRLQTRSPESAVDAAIEGLGLVQATSYQLAPALRRGALQAVLRAHEPPEVPVSLVYPSQRQLPLKLRSFVDHCAPRLQEQLNQIGHGLSSLPAPDPKRVTVTST